MKQVSKLAFYTQSTSEVVLGQCTQGIQHITESMKVIVAKMAIIINHLAARVST